MNPQNDKNVDNKKERMKLNFEASVFEENFRSCGKRKSALENELSATRKKRALLDASVASMETEIKQLESEMLINQEDAKKIRRKINMLID